MVRVLVLGGYGVFGGRAAERLARDPAMTVVIAGRNAARAQAKRAELERLASARAEAVALDALALTSDVLRHHRIDIVVNAVGPYQKHDYRVARACIAAKAHYVDLADARGFVTGISALDDEARTAGVLVVSGASSVPALAAAVIDELTAHVGTPEAVTYGISPGNSFDPGEATVASILATVGKPFTALISGRLQVVHGWQPLTRHWTAATGTRWLGACDVPDLDLFPARYPTLKTQRFVAGVEVRLFHGALWMLSWLVRARILNGLEGYAASLVALKRRLGFLGTDRGMMFVTLEGRDSRGASVQRSWSLVANSGHGPYLPPTPAVIIVRSLAAGRLPRTGAMPCLGLITLDDVTREVADLDIRQTIT